MRENGARGRSGRALARSRAMEDGRQAGERRFQKPASSFLREQRPDRVAAGHGATDASRDGTQPSEPRRVPPDAAAAAGTAAGTRVSLATATVEQLDELPGIGR